VSQYLTAETYKRALYSNNDHARNAFVNGSLMCQTLDLEAGSSPGDKMLANSLLRMQDEMLHYL
jgi:hypothetical protein